LASAAFFGGAAFAFTLAAAFCCRASAFIVLRSSSSVTLSERTTYRTSFPFSKQSVQSGSPT
jgi:hypothetical protein